MDGLYVGNCDGFEVGCDTGRFVGTPVGGRDDS